MVTSLDQLPTELKAPPQPERSRLLNADGSTLAFFYDENRIYEPLARIAPIMQQAQVAIEDHRFYEHGAMDLQGTLRALVRSSQGNTQGGSSLTQQYVRLVLVEIAHQKNDATAKAAATENTIARKIRELRYAIAMEKELSKDTDPRALPEHRLLRGRRLRRRGSSAALLRCHRREARPPPGGHAGRPGAEPRGHQPGRPPGPGDRAAQQRAGPDAGARPDLRHGTGRGQGHQVRQVQGQGIPAWLRQRRVPVHLRLRLPDPAEDHRASATPRRSARTSCSAAASPFRPRSIRRPSARPRRPSRTTSRPRIPWFRSSR